MRIHIDNNNMHIDEAVYLIVHTKHISLKDKFNALLVKMAMHTFDNCIVILRSEPGQKFLCDLYDNFGIVNVRSKYYGIRFATDEEEDEEPDEQ